MDEIQLPDPSLQEDSVAKRGILGFLIGLAVIIPGISGSTFAIILKLYDKLIFAISNLFHKFKLSFFFLLPIAIFAVLGIGIGFLTVQQLMSLIPFAIVALFSGLMLGAYPAVLDEVKNTKKTRLRIILFVIGILVPILISIFSVQFNNKETTDRLLDLNIWEYVLLFAIGYIVAITQIVPGLSATALLMAFGYFQPLLNSFDLTYWSSNPHVFIVYIILVVGFLIGLFTFSKVLSKLFKKRKTTTFYCIIGLSLGSIVSMFYNTDMIEIYNSWNGTNPALDIILGVALFICGALIAYQFVKYERNKEVQVK